MASCSAWAKKKRLLLRQWARSCSWARLWTGPSLKCAPSSSVMDTSLKDRGFYLQEGVETTYSNTMAVMQSMARTENCRPLP